MSSMSHPGLTLLLLPFGMLQAAATDRPPVVLVPGLASSQLEVRVRPGFDPYDVCADPFKTEDHQWHRMWIDATYFTPVWTPCFLKRMSFDWDDAQDLLEEPKGLESRTTGWGNTSSIDYLDPDLWPSPIKDKGVVWGYFIDHMVKEHGYEVGKDLRGAPFDWRLAPSSGRMKDMLLHLKLLVEETSRKQGAKVVLVSHSYGGTVARFFLRSMPQSWKDEFVASWVSIGGVFGGSTKILSSLGAGDNEDIVTLRGRNVRDAQRTWESMWWMVPDPRVFDSQTTVFAQSPSRNYTLSTLRDFFVQTDFEAGYDFFTKRVKPLEDDLTPVGVTLHCFFSTGIDTPSYMVFDTDDLQNDPQIINTKKGDGSANDASLELCRKMNPVSVHTYDGVEHLDMILKPKTIADIAAAILSHGQERSEIVV